MPSKVIAGIEYDPANSTMKITFVSGNIYLYKNVPEQVYLAFRASGVKGNFLNQHIKPYFRYEKVA